MSAYLLQPATRSNVQQTELPTLPTLTFAQWYGEFSRSWAQGEHVALIGQTGSGKTTLAGRILDIRGHVVSLAVKREDDTIKQLTGRWALIRKWPPAYHQKRAIIWVRPGSLDLGDLRDQAEQCHKILNHVFKDGGWAVFLDDTGFIAGSLRLNQDITVLLNQGRSSGISVVCAMTQPSSVTARVPSEAFRQCRHILAFRYRNRRDVEAIAHMTGYDWQDVRMWMEGLGVHDFLAFSPFGVSLVRAEMRRK